MKVKQKLLPKKKKSLAKQAALKYCLFSKCVPAWKFLFGDGRFFSSPDLILSTSESCQQPRSSHVSHAYLELYLIEPKPLRYLIRLGGVHCGIASLPEFS